jgi:hypothetical protein
MRTPLFYLSAALLCCNDFVWKSQFNNALTGKISDFAGIALWVLFWEAWLPQRFRAHLYILTALFFTWFKSPLSESFLQFLNLFRVVDYTDLWALLVLLPLYFLDKKTNIVTWQPTVAGSIFALFLFCATSVDRGENPNIFGCTNQKYGFKIPKDSLITGIKLQFPTQNQVETAQQDSSFVSIGFRYKGCEKGASANFTLKPYGSDSCTLFLNQITVVCKPESIDNSALCKVLQDTIIQKIR